MIPSPYNNSQELGLKFHHLPNAIYDRGGSRTNRLEAQAVAEAVMQHARVNQGKTLGVGTFSVAQRDAILDELELKRRESPELEDFFSTASSAPFFVKNLENIQGDERDVIFISVCYGRDSFGKIPMKFGPINNEGGERRLNVLISRSRERCEVFSSITDEDINLNRTQSRGVKSLKSFLKYARTGQLDMPISSERGHDSIFEEEVDRALTALGYDVVPQTKEAGLFIDLAIVDPEKPGRYLLGIECDGASYHSSRWARDRDRIRQQVLEDRGWNIHRIWSTDWFHRPGEETRKVVAAIENAKLEASIKSDADSLQSQSSETHSTTPLNDSQDQDNSIERHSHELSIASHDNDSSVPYAAAFFLVDRSKEIHDLPLRSLSAIVVKIVEVEGPIHQDEIARRVTGLWELSRTGRRITESVIKATEAAGANSRISCDGLFWLLPSQEDIKVRDRSKVESKTLCKPEHIPPAEICMALETVISNHLGVSEEEVIKEVASLLGLGSRAASFKKIVLHEIQSLISSKECEQRNGNIYCVRQPHA